MTSANSCCRPSAARRWPPLNGQPSNSFVVGPVGCQWIWTACRAAMPLVRGAPKKGPGGGYTLEGRRQPGGPRRRGRGVSDHATDLATETFIAYRNLLFTVAYEMLGSAADAEDVLQETWLR